MMQKISSLFKTLSLLVCLSVNTLAFADIEWSGVYRFEGTFLKNSELNAKDKELTYGQHHLILRPKIVAGDGFTIYGQFDILNEQSVYPNSQIGQIWGSGVRGGGLKDGTSNSFNSNAVAQNQAKDTVAVSQLYMTLSHEFGQLIVGRAPVQFGLGITHNAGRGLFDHWYDSRDLIGYKFVVGNLFFLPMYGKAAEGNFWDNDDLNDYMIQMQYENPESDLELGVFYQIRSGSDQSSDAPADSVSPPGPGAVGGVGSKHTGGVNMKTVNIYALRNSDNFRLGLEASFQSGEMGVQTAGGENVSMSGFGVAAEMSYRAEGSRWTWGLKGGTASGDDPATSAKYEGFVFDPNYEIGMMMFNHPLGQADFMRTGFETGRVRSSAPELQIQAPDVERISNVLYLSPSFKYAFNDRWSVDNTLVTGWLGTDPLAGVQNVSKDLGYEWDLSINFVPRKGVMWVNQAGVLFPGGAWEGGGQFDSNMAFGFKTKAAISF